MTKLAILFESFNELSVGYNDSGCFFRFQYGPRGAGAMIDSCGEYFFSEADDLDAAVDEFIEFLSKTKPAIREKFSGQTTQP